jgi:hypothetical protein
LTVVYRYVVAQTLAARLTNSVSGSAGNLSQIGNTPSAVRVHDMLAVGPHLQPDETLEPHVIRRNLMRAEHGGTAVGFALVLAVSMSKYATG